MSGNSGMVSFLYGSCVGRGILKGVMSLHLDRIAVWFLRSPCSRLLNGWFMRKNGIHVTAQEAATFRSFRDMFARKREIASFDECPGHLISPCDGWLSVFPIEADSSFALKGSHYSLRDFLQDEELARSFLGGTCLIFRLCVSDYHRYCYLDDGFQGENHFIPGQLHSVQPIACEAYPVFVRNRRSWCRIDTDHFGPVVQCEIGALVVGGIVNHLENSRVCRGSEKGHFDLAGSTIVVLVQKDRIQLRPELAEQLTRAEEVQVKMGEWIATAEGKDS